MNNETKKLAGQPQGEEATCDPNLDDSDRELRKDPDVSPNQETKKKAKPLIEPQGPQGEDSDVDHTLKEREPKDTSASLEEDQGNRTESPLNN